MSKARVKLSAAGCMIAASLAFVSITATPASAALVYGASGICPLTAGHSPAGGAGTGNATDCNLFITFNPNGSIVTTAGPQTNYESIEDSLIGVINNSGHTITGFHLSNTGVAIMGFDGDGINLYTFDDTGGVHEQNIGPAGTNPDLTGYGGYNAWFTNIAATLDSGDVMFANGGIKTGHTDFFSLEEPASLNLVVTNTPEPATLTLLGVGLAGLAFGRRRQSKKS